MIERALLWRSGTLVLLLALAGGGCAFDELTRSGDARPSPDACAACHVEIHAEWASSAHARAFAGPSYAAITADHAFPACVRCHAPDSVFPEGPVAARHVRREFGVDCVSCHLDGEALTGPLPSSALGQPHPIVEENPLYSRSDLCGRCHEGTFRQWTDSAPTEPDGSVKRTCQECHMPRVTRTVTQATDSISTILVAAETEHAQRRHRFDLTAVSSFERTATLELDRVDGGLAVTVHNQLPHTLPTGDFGPRNVEALVAFHAADGRELGRETLLWSVRLHTAVAAFGADTRILPIPPETRGASVTLTRPARPGTEAFVLASAKWRSR